ncbi:hypothetical protein [Streptomyces sp. BP-8]|uniref:Uncharacterized protein n=1 Tax=Streptomyces sirii TaxID=3127701 RepID=A0ABZ2QSB8_9ACTN
MTPKAAERLDGFARSVTASSVLTGSGLRACDAAAEAVAPAAWTVRAAAGAGVLATAMPLVKVVPISADVRAATLTRVFLTMLSPS